MQPILGGGAIFEGAIYEGAILETLQYTKHGTKNHNKRTKCYFSLEIFRIIVHSGRLRRKNVAVAELGDVKNL